MELNAIQILLLSVSFAFGLGGATTAMLKERNVFLWTAMTFAVPLSLVVLLLLPALPPPPEPGPARAPRRPARSRDGWGSRMRPTSRGRIGGVPYSPWLHIANASSHEITQPFARRRR